MKLHEIKGKPSSGSSFETITVDTFNYGDVKLRVEYYWEGESTTRHGDNASFDEHDPGTLEVTKVTLAQSLEDFDKDGEPTKTWPKGTDVSELAHWSKHDDKYVDKELEKALKAD